MPQKQHNPRVGDTVAVRFPKFADGADTKPDYYHVR